MQTLAGAEDALYLHWEVPGKPMAVYLSRAVTRAILLGGRRGLMPRRPPEVGGILLGTVTVAETVTIRIEARVELPCAHLFGPSYTLSEDEKETLRHTLAQYGPGAAGEMCAVGFYRTHTRRGLTLDSDDLQLAEFFPEGADLVLLIKRRMLRPGRAAFFFWDDAQTEPGVPAIEFSVPRRGSPDYAIAPAASPGAPRARPAARRTRWWWSWWVQAPLLAFLVVAWYVMGFVGGRQIDNVVPRAAPPPRDPYALSLMVLQYGDNLHLTWDRESRPIAAAERGSLLISDGDQSRTLDLTLEQLRTGAVAYHRLSDKVRFRLEVTLPGHRSVSETWEYSAAGQ